MKIEFLDILVNQVIYAGEKILELYSLPKEEQEITTKTDGSPLSKADKASNRIITETIKNYDTKKLPIISEEERLPDYEERKHWQYFWLIDPLDGTKEFINKNDEFTVNIALIHGDKPVFGIVYCPVLGDLYLGYRGKSYHVNEKKSMHRALNIRNIPLGDKKIALCSRYHKSTVEKEMNNLIGVTSERTVGSSLKFCLLAAGDAHTYNRVKPTMEWDTAAGQAILEGAGGYVYDGKTFSSFLKYNKKNMVNNAFFSSVYKNDIFKLKGIYNREIIKL